MTQRFAYLGVSRSAVGPSTRPGADDPEWSVYQGVDPCEDCGSFSAVQLHGGEALFVLGAALCGECFERHANRIGLHPVWRAE